LGRRFGYNANTFGYEANTFGYKVNTRAGTFLFIYSSARSPVNQAEEEPHEKL